MTSVVPAQGFHYLGRQRVDLLRGECRQARIGREAARRFVAGLDSVCGSATFHFETLEDRFNIYPERFQSPDKFIIEAPVLSQAIQQLANRIPLRLVRIPVVAAVHGYRRQSLLAFEWRSVHRFTAGAYTEGVDAVLRTLDYSFARALRV